MAVHAQGSVGCGPANRLTLDGEQVHALAAALAVLDRPAWSATSHA
jgi:hypothetical protein